MNIMNEWKKDDLDAASLELILNRLSDLEQEFYLTYSEKDYHQMDTYSDYLASDYIRRLS